MTIFDEEEWEFKMAKIDKELHKKLKALHVIAGYDYLQDFINDGLRNWVKFTKEVLKNKKNKIH